MATVSFYRKRASETPTTTEGAITFRDTAGIFIGTGSALTGIATYTTVIQNTGSLSIGVNGSNYQIYKVINTVSEATNPNVLYIFEA